MQTRRRLCTFKCMARKAEAEDEDLRLVVAIGVVHVLKEQAERLELRVEFTVKSTVVLVSWRIGYGKF